MVVALLEYLNVLTPLRVARLKYIYKTHQWPHFRHPRDLNEKINYLKFYTDTTAWSPLTDKCAVRDYVKSAGLEDTLVKLYAKYDSPAGLSQLGG